MLKKCLKVYGNITLEQLINHIENETYIDIYTDGATQYNGVRRSGIGVYFGDNDERNVSKLVNAIDNNEAEILAAIEALSICLDKHYYVNIYTDSRLIVDVIHHHSKSKILLFVQLQALITSFIDVKFIYVKGHNNIDGNEKADALSRALF